MIQGYFMDESHIMKFLAYDVKTFPLIRLDECLIISDFIKKPDNTIIITSKTDVFAAAKTSIQETCDFNEKLQELTKTEPMDILTASRSPQKTSVTVTGKVVVSNKKTTKRSSIKNEDIPFKRIKIKDETSIIGVALWRDMSSSDIPVGSYVKLTNFNTTSTYDKNKKGQKQVLANKTGSSIEFLPLPDDDAISSDEDSEDETTNMDIGNVIALEHHMSYRSCLNDKCYFKKLSERLNCMKCNVQYTETTAGHAVVMKLLIKGNRISKYTIFTQEFSAFVKLLNITLDLSNVKATLPAITAMLPISVSFKAEGDTLKVIKPTI